MIWAAEPKLSDGTVPVPGQIIRYWAGSKSDIAQFYVYLGGRIGTLTATDPPGDYSLWRFASMADGKQIPLSTEGLTLYGEHCPTAKARRRQMADALRGDAIPAGG